MHNGLKIGAIVLALFGVPALAGAQEETKTLFGDLLKDNGVEVAVSGATDFYSKYVWRGFLLDDDWVAQPSLSIAVGGFEAGVWGSWDVQSEDTRASDEIDSWFSYTHTVENLSFTVGHTYYEFSEADTFSKEYFVSVGLAVPLAPTLTWYHDYGDETQGGGDGDYIVLDLSHSFALVENYGITLDLGGHVGYNNELFIRGNGGDVLLKAGLTIPVTKTFKVSPLAYYSIPFGDLKADNDGNQDKELFGGVSASYTF